MRLIGAAVYRGPHLYSVRPMIRLEVDLETLEDWPSNRIEGFNAGLLGLLPGLAAHGCSYHQPGGLVQRLEAGTWLGHVAEHVALELQTLAGHRVSRGKTRSVKGRQGVYNILYTYNDEAVGLEAGLAALRLVDSLLPPALQGLKGVAGADQAFDLRAVLRDLEARMRRSSLGPTTASLVREARRRGIPVARLNDQSLIRLGWGARQKLIRASVTSHTSLIGAESAGDKALAKALLRAASVPAPRGAVVRSAVEAREAAKGLKAPLVTKPLDGNHGRGVTLGLESPEAVETGFELAAQHGRRVIVEEQYQGRDFRVLVIDGKVVAVAERVPAQVVGDGRRTIRALVEATNQDPRRGRGHEKVMTRIALDDQVAAGWRATDVASTTSPRPARRCSSRTPPICRPVARPSTAPKSSIPTMPPSPAVQPARWGWTSRGSISSALTSPAPPTKSAAGWWRSMLRRAFGCIWNPHRAGRATWPPP